MPARSPPPEHELDLYPSDAGPSSSSHPLLSNGRVSPPPSPPPPSSSSSRSHRRPRSASLHRRYPTVFLFVKTWWKPLAALSAPFLLLFLYALIHPHVPGLPPLPSVHIDTSGGQWGASAGIWEGDDGGERDCACGATKAGERLCQVYNKEGLRSSRLIEGTGARVRRVLQKAREGQGLKIGILGGSVSACHGLHPSPDFPQGDPEGPGCYTTLLRQWLEDTFPGSDNAVVNGAIGGMDSSYYAFCGTHHIPSDIDLLVLEFDVNDQADLIYQSFFDQLLRVLLEFRSEPAVVVLGAWSPQVAQDQGYGDPQIVHLPIAHMYDIPYISQKRLMFNHYLRYPKSVAEAFYQPDALHPNFRGHRVLADLLMAYLETELCRLTHWGLPIVPSHQSTLDSTLPSSSLVEVPFALDTLHLVSPTEAPSNWESTFDPERLALLSSEARHFVLPTSPYGIPPVGIFTPLRDVVDPRKPDPPTGEHVLGLAQPKLFCADANDHQNPMEPTSSAGWDKFVWNGEKHFWVSNTVGARIRVEIKVNAGRVAVYYYRSSHYDLGDALCWVDDNEQGAVSLPGYWDKQYNVAIVAYIDEKVTPGDHYVTCEIAATTSHPTNSRAHNWRLVAVMAT